MNKLKNKNGISIENGQIISYNGKQYIATYIEKDNIGWIGRPCGNTDGDDINLVDLENEIE